jgi:hypothetical protein
MTSVRIADHQRERRQSNACRVARARSRESSTRRDRAFPCGSRGPLADSRVKGWKVLPISSGLFFGDQKPGAEMVTRRVCSQPQVARFSRWVRDAGFAVAAVKADSCPSGSPEQDVRSTEQVAARRLRERVGERLPASASNAGWATSP